MVYTYLLKSVKAGGYYVGISKNPEVRLRKHNEGEVRSTKNKRPWTLVFKKQHHTYSKARKHEKWLKKKNHKYKAHLEQIGTELAPPK